MKKLTTMFLVAFMAGKLLIAQSVDDARKNLYYGKTTSARQQLDKIIAGNPKDAKAIYWLGQLYLGNDSVESAKKVYQDALNAGVNDPWIWVGMGHVNVRQGQKDAARQQFEQAITATTKKKKEDVNILNAIGRANADGDAKTGDPAYAIEKLKKASELDPANSDVFTNMGINYLKLGNEQGGNAYEAYTNALKADPNNARAKFRLGKIFESQGNTERFLQYYNDAVTGDPLYAPAYIELYDYYSNRDVNKAREYLDKYITNSDKDCNTDFFYADYLFRSGKYQESLDKAKAMETGVCSSYARLKVLYAYNYDRLGDSLQARSNIESYLSAANPTLVRPTDYEFAGKVLLKFPGQEGVASSYLEKAMESDTVVANKITYVNSILETLGKDSNYPAQVIWYKKLQTVKPDLTARDLYFYSDAALRAGDFNTADTVANMYIQKFSDQPQGYAALAKAAIARDTDTTAGTAAPAVQRYIDWMISTDKEKYKNTIIANYGYLVALHANGTKDYAAAIKDLEGILVVDPTNTYAQSTIVQLKKVMNPPKASAPVKKATTTKKKS